jgi:beta-galactosidase
MLRNSLTHVARGADAVCFFQWRASAQGAEKFHSALVPHAGTDTAAWREVLALSSTLDALAEVAGTTVRADVAVLFSWQSWWATDTEARPSQDVRYLDQVHAAYRSVRGLGYTADVVAPGTDLSRYRLVVVPCLHLVSDQDAAGINAYVAGGGHAVVTFYSGIVDDADRVRLGGYPGAFREMLGVVAEEFFPLLPGHRVTLTGGATASLWTEQLRATTAEIVDSYADGPLPGVPAVTRNSYGQGTSWYVATALDDDGLRDLLRDAGRAAGVRAAGPETDGSVEVVRRAGGGSSYVFVINHGEQDIEHTVTGHDLLTGEAVPGVLKVGAGCVRVVREEPVS